MSNLMGSPLLVDVFEAPAVVLPEVPLGVLPPLVLPELLGVQPLSNKPPSTTEIPNVPLRVRVKREFEKFIVVGSNRV